MSDITDLVANLNAIHTETITKILPENIKAGVTIFGVTGTLSTNTKVFSTVEDMEAYTGAIEDDFAIVYGTTYVGTYRYDNNSWTQLGDSSQGQQIMDILNSVLGPVDQYEGMGGTDTEINDELNNILGIEEV